MKIIINKKKKNVVDERQVLAAHVCAGVFVTVIYYKIEIDKNKK